MRSGCGTSVEDSSAASGAECSSSIVPRSQFFTRAPRAGCPKAKAINSSATQGHNGRPTRPHNPYPNSCKALLQLVPDEGRSNVRSKSPQLNPALHQLAAGMRRRTDGSTPPTVRREGTTPNRAQPHRKPPSSIRTKFHQGTLSTRASCPTNVLMRRKAGQRDLSQRKRTGYEKAFLPPIRHSAGPAAAPTNPSMRQRRKPGVFSAPQALTTVGEQWIVPLWACTALALLSCQGPPRQLTSVATKAASVANGLRFSWKRSDASPTAVQF